MPWIEYSLTGVWWKFSSKFILNVNAYIHFMSYRFSGFVVMRHGMSLKTLIYIVIRQRYFEEEGAKWREDIDAFWVIKFVEDMFETFAFLLNDVPTMIPGGL